jgi:aspartate racemase
MGALATWAFYGELIRATLAVKDEDHLHVVIDADPRIPDRTRFLLGIGDDPRERLLESARRLVVAGCEILAMPCNTAHAFGDDIRAAVPIPLMNWIEVTAAAIESGGNEPVGLLATAGTIRVGLYQRALAARRLPLIEPPSEDVETIMEAIYGPEGVKGSGGASARSQQRLLEVANRLAARGATRILLGCTELPLAVATQDPRWAVPAIDPAVANARELVRAAGTTLVLANRTHDCDGDLDMSRSASQNPSGGVTAGTTEEARE